MPTSRSWLVVIAVVFILGAALGFSIRPSIDAKMSEDTEENVRLTMAAQSVYSVEIPERKATQFLITCEGCVVTINHQHDWKYCDEMAVSYNGVTYTEDFITTANGNGSWTVFLNDCEGVNSATFTVFFPTRGSIVKY